MAKHTLVPHLIARAKADPNYRANLKANPKAVLEAAMTEIQEKPFKLPTRTKVHIHYDTTDDIHIVLPDFDTPPLADLSVEEMDSINQMGSTAIKCD